MLVEQSRATLGGQGKRPAIGQLYFLKSLKKHIYIFIMKSLYTVLFVPEHIKPLLCSLPQISHF